MTWTWNWRPVDTTGQHNIYGYRCRGWSLWRAPGSTLWNVTYQGKVIETDLTSSSAAQFCAQQRARSGRY